MPLKKMGLIAAAAWAVLAASAIAGGNATQTAARTAVAQARLEEVGSWGSLEDDKLLMWVGLAVDEDGLLYVTDALDYSVKVFDPKGRLLRRAGRAGAGPGEFQAIRELALSRDQVFITDQYRPAVFVFNKQLQFQRAISQPRPISCLRGLPEGILAAACVPLKKGTKPVLWLAEASGRTLREISFGTDAAHPAADRVSFVPSGQGFILAYNFKDKIERLDGNGRVVWSRSLFHLPDSKLKKVLGTDLPTDFVYKDIAADRAGRLYVLGGTRAEHPSRDVYILHPAGEMIAAAVLPEATHCLVIDAQDFLYSRANDGLTIKKYKVRLPVQPTRTPAKAQGP